MTGDVMQQLLNEVIRNVDMVVLICLLALGFCIKHFKFLAKVQNDLIPPFLLFVAIVIEFIQHGFSITSIVIAIVTTAIAIGLHTQGKNIFTVTIIPKIIELLKGISSGIEDSLLGEDDEYECDVGEEEAGEDSD